MNTRSFSRMDKMGIKIEGKNAGLKPPQAEAAIKPSPLASSRQWLHEHNPADKNDKNAICAPYYAPYCSYIIRFIIN